MAFRASCFLGLTAMLFLPYAVAHGLYRPAKRPVARLWFRICQSVCGLTVNVRGVPEQGGSLLYTANHVSYLDIIVLGRILDAKFVAKSDVAKWPLFGLLSRMAETVFVTRNRRHAARDSRRLKASIVDGERLIMFPEGTSSDGRAVLPFISTLFAAVDPQRTGGETRVQPVSIAYQGYADGRPLRGDLADLYAWYGEMTMFGHLMTVFGLKGATVEVRFLPPLRAGDFADRKTLAASAETAVRDGLAASLRP